MTSPRRCGSTNGSPIRKRPSPTTCCRGSAARRSRLETGRRPPQAYVRVYYEFPLTDAATLAGRAARALQDQIKRTGYKLDLGRAQILFGARRYGEARTAFQDLQQRGRGRRQGARRSPRRGVRFPVEAIRRGARRRAAVPGTGLAQGRSAVLLSRAPPRARRSRAVHRADGRARRRFSRQLVGRGGAEQPRHALHRHQRRRRWRRRRSRSCTSKFPDGHACGARGVEVRLVGLHERATTPRPCGCSRAPRSRSRAPTIGRRSCTGPPARTRSSGRARRRTRGCGSSTPTTRTRTTAGSPSVSSRAARRPSPADGVRLASREQAPAPAAPPIPTDSLIRLLLANGLYDDALDELRYAQRAWGSSTRIDATIAWAYHQKGELRRAITLMRRAYPQYPDGGRRAAARGDPPGHLSADVLGVDPQAFGAARARSVPRRRAHRAGVHLRSGRSGPWRTPGD